MQNSFNTTCEENFFLEDLENLGRKLEKIGDVSARRHRVKLNSIIYDVIIISVLMFGAISVSRQPRERVCESGTDLGDPPPPGPTKSACVFKVTQGRENA